MPGAIWICTHECHHHLITFAIIWSVSNTQVLVAFAWVARWFQWEGYRSQSFSHPSSLQVAGGSVYTHPTEVVFLFCSLFYEGWGLLLGLSYHHSPYSMESKTSVRILQWLRILTPIIFSEPGGATHGMSRCSFWTHCKVDLSSISLLFICSVVSNSLWLHGLQYTRLSCPRSPCCPVHCLAQTHVHWVGSIYHLHADLHIILALWFFRDYH